MRRIFLEKLEAYVPYLNWHGCCGAKPIFTFPEFPSTQPLLAIRAINIGVIRQSLA
jgi:hypothetical protein